MDPIQLSLIALVGLLSGLGLLVRGLASYRDASRIGDTATSRIGSLAIGEVRVSGVVEPAEMVLVSPLQSERCVYYAAHVDQSDEDSTDEVFADQRAIGFRVRDATGSLRVFPRGARFDVPDRWDERDDGVGASGLNPRRGPVFAAAEPTREEQIAELLTLRTAASTDAGLVAALGDGFAVFGSRRRRRYREARIEPGDVVTVIGQVLPFDQLADPAGANEATSGAVGAIDEETAANLAEARAAGRLAASPQEAWGNAAIAGFGIGRPVSTPVLDPEAEAPPLATPDQAAVATRTFAIGPHDLVLAAADVPLVVALGSPGEATARHEDRFLLGLLGALLAIGSAVALAGVWNGGLPG